MGQKDAAMTDHSGNDDARRRRLLWRATHRGIKEMDLILGGFVTRHVARLDDARLSDLESIMDIPDQEMLAWATKQEPVPPELATPLLLEILSTSLLPREKEGTTPQAWEDEGTGCT